MSGISVEFFRTNKYNEFSRVGGMELVAPGDTLMS